MARRVFLSLGLLGLGRLRGLGAAARFGIDDRIRNDAREAALGMRFTGRTAAEAREWQQGFRAQLDALLGSYRRPVRWESVLERSTELSDHIREERLLMARGFDPVPIYVLRPRDARGRKRGGIVAIHGHGVGHDTVAGRDDTPEFKAQLARLRDDYGLQLVRRGFVVAERFAGGHEWHGDVAYPLIQRVLAG